MPDVRVDLVVERPRERREISKEERIAALCRDLSGVAVPLVDAFGIPERCIAAPIAAATT